MKRLFQDARFGIRLLRRQPGFTATAVLSLTIGIVASTLIFTFLKALFMPALPVKDASDLVLIYSTTQGKTGQLIQYQSTSYLNATDYQRRSRDSVFSGLAIIVDSNCTLERRERTSPVVLNLTTADYFDVLGIRPERGRVISKQDDDPSSPPVVVVSHALWLSQLDGDEHIVGTTIRLNQQPYTVIGVMPPQFANVGELPTADVWIPAVWHDQLLTGNIRAWYSRRAARVASMVARLKPGVSFREAEAAMTAIGAQLQRDYPNDNAGRNVMLVPLLHTIVPPAQRAIYVRAGAITAMIVSVVLLIACSNVAHLLLARATQRRDEFVVRLALGASRRDIVSQLLTEGLLLAAIASAIGLAAAYGVKALATTLVPAALRANLDFSFDVRVLLFTVGVSMLATVIFALGPAWRASSAFRTARIGTLETRAIGSRRSVHTLLLVGQIGLAMVALVTAGLFIRSLQAAQATDLGFDLDRQVVASIDLADSRYPPARVATIYGALTERLRALPGVANAAISDTPPLHGSYRRTVFPADVDINNPANGRLSGVIAVAPRFFDTLGMRLLRGRDFDDRDSADHPMVAIVNEAAAKILWAGEGDDPLGKRLRFLLQDWDVSVVGVVNTVTYANVNEAAQPIIYMPLKQHPSTRAFAYVRTAGDPNAAANTIRAAIAALDSKLGSTEIETGPQVLAGLLTERRLGAEVLGAFGLVALVLAVIGTYGVVSYVIGQTTREIGIRIALGSTRREIFVRFVSRNLAAVTVGITLGLFLELLVTRLTASMLFGVSLFDPVSFASTAALLLATALVACAVPVWRASNVDPMIVLR